MSRASHIHPSKVPIVPFTLWLLLQSKHPANNRSMQATQGTRPGMEESRSQAAAEEHSSKADSPGKQVSEPAHSRHHGESPLHSTRTEGTQVWLLVRPVHGQKGLREHCSSQAWRAGWPRGLCSVVARVPD